MLRHFRFILVLISVQLLLIPMMVKVLRVVVVSVSMQSVLLTQLTPEKPPGTALLVLFLHQRIARLG
jgi:hypothetical protein